jgi:hypothetical protein
MGMAMGHFKIGKAHAMQEVDRVGLHHGRDRFAGEGAPYWQLPACGARRAMQEQADQE